MRNKFRAWDSKRSEWFGESNPDCLTFTGFAIFGECTLMCTPRMDDFKHFIYEQYTGLKDKNGVEVCEGDVLTNSKHNCNYAVLWDNRRCRFIGKGNEGDKYGPYTLKISIASQYEENLFKKELEVIGNIHENPELLEK